MPFWQCTGADCHGNPVGIRFEDMPSEFMTLSLIKINGGQSHVS